MTTLSVAVVIDEGHSFPPIDITVTDEENLKEAIKILKDKVNKLYCGIYFYTCDRKEHQPLYCTESEEGYYCNASEFGEDIILSSLERSKYYTCHYEKYYCVVFALDHYSKFPVYSKYYRQKWMEWDKDPEKELSFRERARFNIWDDPNYYDDVEKDEENEIAEKELIKKQGELIKQQEETIKRLKEVIERLHTHMDSYHTEFY